MKKLDSEKKTQICSQICHNFCFTISKLPNTIPIVKTNKQKWKN